MAHHISNINVRHRLTQIIVLVVSILAVLLFAQLAHAQRPNNKPKFDKPKYRIAVYKNSGKACNILHKKRTTMLKHPLFASARRSKTNRALAETDPSRIVTSN